MSRKYKFKDNDKLYFITYTVVNWIDVFIREEYKNILVNSWRHCIEHKGLEVYGWCIMTRHIHMIIGSKKHKLESIVYDMKVFTSKSIKQSIKEHPEESRREWMLWMMERAGKKNGNNADFQFWQQNNHPLEISSQDMAWQKLEYIHNNPVKGGIVEKPEDYLYSSARDYNGLKGMLDIILLDAITQTLWHK